MKRLLAGSALAMSLATGVIAAQSPADVERHIAAAKVAAGSDHLGLFDRICTEARPLAMRFPLRLDPEYEWWEYACHEGNRTIADYISASRAERAARAEAAGR